MTAAARGGGVPCPNCGGGLLAALEMQVEIRLTRSSAPDGWVYSLGALHTHVPQLRARALRQHGDGQHLELDEEGIVVMCRSCDFTGTLTDQGLETQEDRDAQHREIVRRSRDEGAEL